MSAHTDFTERTIEYDKILSDLKKLAVKQLSDDGIPFAKQRFTAIAECRYVGQGFELRAAMPKDALSKKNIGTVIKNFYEAHKQVYGHAFEDQLVEVVTLRVVGSVGRGDRRARDDCAGAIDHGSRDFRRSDLRRKSQAKPKQSRGNEGYDFR